MYKYDPYTRIHFPLLPAVCLCVVALLLSGCMTPDIADREWKYLRVVYLARDENGQLEPLAWHSKDREVLKRLRAAFPTGKYDPMPKPWGVPSHRVDIKTRWGQWWSLTHMRDAGGLPFIQFYDETRTNPLYWYHVFKFSSALHDQNNPIFFFVTLTTEIKRVSGIDVNLHTEYCSGELDALEGNTASRYERVFGL